MPGASPHLHPVDKPGDWQPNGLDAGDVDDDGDPDPIANCEEYNRLRRIIAVAWFENPLVRIHRP